MDKLSYALGHNIGHQLKEMGLQGSLSVDDYAEAVRDVLEGRAAKMGAEEAHMVLQQFCMAGGRNIAEEVSGWSYSLEALMKEDPDYIIVRREDSAAFCSMKPYNALRAVRQGHVIGMESGTMDLQVPRNIDAILTLRHRMKQ